MARNVICPDCGVEFDAELTEERYDAKYGPKYAYSNLEEEFCYACAAHYTEAGVVEPVNSFTIEREPDINHHLGSYN